MKIKYFLINTRNYLKNMPKMYELTKSKRKQTND